VGELVKLLKLCRKLPFDETAIREANIGKVIRKLKKFKSTKGNVGELNTQIENIMTKWRAKQQQLAEMAAVLAKNNSTVIVDAVAVGDVSDSMVDKLKDVRAERSSIAPSVHLTADKAFFESPTPIVAENRSSKNEIVKNNLIVKGDVQASQQLVHSKPITMTPLVTSFIIKDLSAARIVSTGFTSSSTTIGGANLASTLPSAATDVNNQRFPIHAKSTAAMNAVTAEIKPVTAAPPARERKPLDMAESARRLLAMRAEKQQQQQSQQQLQPTDSANKSNSADDPAVSINAPTPTVTSILSAVGKESIMNGLAKALKDEVMMLCGA